MFSRYCCFLAGFWGCVVIPFLHKALFDNKLCTANVCFAYVDCAPQHRWGDQGRLHWSWPSWAPKKVPRSDYPMWSSYVALKGWLKKVMKLWVPEVTRTFLRHPVTIWPPEVRCFRYIFWGSSQVIPFQQVFGCLGIVEWSQEVMNLMLKKRGAGNWDGDIFYPVHVLYVIVVYLHIYIPLFKANTHTVYLNLVISMQSPKRHAKTSLYLFGVWWFPWSSWGVCCGVDPCLLRCKCWWIMS